MYPVNIKRVYVSIALLLYTGMAVAQIPTTTARPVAIPVPLSPPYINPVVNYVRTWEPLMPTTDPLIATGTGRTVKEVRQSTTYTDGLGRQLQTVIKGISISGKDMVAPVTYDAYGRQQYEIMPYTQQSANTNDGKFKNDPQGSQRSFYRNVSLNAGVAADSIFYSQTEYDATPSSDALKSYAPGSSWAREGGAKARQQYQFINTAADSVRIWDMPASGNIPGSTRMYAGGQLFKSVEKDESGMQTILFRDKEGRVVLRKVQLSAAPGTGHIGWLCTYFVYDDLDRIRFVIPPLAVEKIIPSWNLAGVAAGLCFMYRYDDRDRCIVSKAAGADSLETVFDTRSRPALQRNGNMKAKGQWFVTFYDEQDRPVRIALYQAATAREVLQGQVNGVAPGTFPFIPAAALTDLYLLYYDDNYTFPGVQALVTADLLAPKSGTNAYPENNNGISHRTNGMITGARIRVPNSNQWLSATFYYNDRGRRIQVITDNINGGKEVQSLLYDFSGRLLSTYLRHNNPRSIATPQTTVLQMMTYDGAGNLVEVATQFNDNAATKRILAAYTYDESGQVKNKRIGVKDAIAMETQQYEFNIQGWLKSINKDFINTAGSTAGWFGLELSYDHGFSINQYDGAIAGTKWKSRGDGIARALGYTYDNTDRLLKAEFSQQNQGSTAWTQDKVNFTTSAISYDANGNIGGMQQVGMNGLSLKIIDSLKYGYIANTNRLSFVTDRKNDPQSKLGDFKEPVNNESADYTYDAAGNILTDLNKGINAIRYNFLNLPDSISVQGKGYITYLYDAGGNKLRKRVVDNSSTPLKTVTTDYINGFVYQNDSLLFFGHDEGRVRVLYASGQAPAYVYDYFIADHLGNTRMVLTEQTGTGTYAATMEAANTAKENALFANVNNTRSAKPVGYPVDATTTPNDYVSKLNAGTGTQKIGTSLVLRVMAGDTIQLGVKAFYKSAAASTSSTPVATMLAALLQAFSTGGAPADGIHGNGTGAGAPITNFSAANYQQLRDKDPSQNQAAKPKAYLNYVLFDEQLNLVDENSGVRQVQGSPDQLQTLATNKFVVKKTGFFYVYTTNESIQDVYFDNLVVTHTNGPLIEETHYYPFGLTMAGISSRALKNPYAENKFNYNGIEQTIDLGLNQYDAFYRTLDPQTGRWWQQDPAMHDYAGISPYNSNFNNPISFSDPQGDDPFWSWLSNVFTGPGPGIQLKTVDITAPRLYRNSADGLIRNFQTNGFSQIGLLATVGRRTPAYTGYDLRSLNIRQPKVINLPEVTISPNRMIDGFPASQRNWEPYEWSPNAFQEAIRSQQKSFIFVTDYFAPVVTTIASGGLEGILVSGPVKALAPGVIFSVARNTARRAALTNAQLVQRAATKAEAAIGGTGRFAGTAKHTYANNLLKRYQSIFGDRGLLTNFSFNRGIGNRGILDVLDQTNGIIYDFKFGNAFMNAAQFNKYTRNFPFPIQIIRP